MFDPRQFPTVTDWRTLEEGTIERTHSHGATHGVTMRRVDNLGDEFVVVRTFGRNGGDGVRIVYQGESRDDANTAYDTHLTDSTEEFNYNRFRMTPNGS
jgi:hypothetical protein